MKVHKNPNPFEDLSGHTLGQIHNLSSITVSVSYQKPHPSWMNWAERFFQTDPVKGWLYLLKLDNGWQITHNGFPNIPAQNVSDNTLIRNFYPGLRIYHNLPEDPSLKYMQYWVEVEPGDVVSPVDVKAFARNELAYEMGTAENLFFVQFPGQPIRRYSFRDLQRHPGLFLKVDFVSCGHNVYMKPAEILKYKDGRKWLRWYYEGVLEAVHIRDKVCPICSREEEQNNWLNGNRDFYTTYGRVLWFAGRKVLKNGMVQVEFTPAAWDVTFTSWRAENEARQNLSLGSHPHGYPGDSFIEILSSEDETMGIFVPFESLSGVFTKKILMEYSHPTGAKYFSTILKR